LPLLGTISFAFALQYCKAQEKSPWTRVAFTNQGLKKARAKAVPIRIRVSLSLPRYGPLLTRGMGGLDPGDRLVI
jgi:hypothetical protein